MTLEDAVSVFSFSRHLYSAGFGEKKKKMSTYFSVCVESCNTLTRELKSNYFSQC